MAFLQFHNKVVGHVRDGGLTPPGRSTFEAAQQFVRWHYQWIVLHEFLPAIVGQPMVDAVLRGRAFYSAKNEAFIPVEFAVAAYRFGHSMVRDGILGELKKLGVTNICRSTVINILREHRLDPKTDPKKGNWADFLKAHAESLWQCDFFSKNVVTDDGIRQAFVLAFLHVSSRRVWVSPAIFYTSARWMQAQAAAFVRHLEEQNLPASLVLLDRDCAYGDGFLGTLAEAGAKPHRVCFKSPNMNAFIERFVQSVQQECLDKFVVFGREHMDLLVSEYVEHYHHERPHQSKGNRPLMGNTLAIGADGAVVCRERLGGVLRHYYREAA